MNLDSWDSLSLSTIFNFSNCAECEACCLRRELTYIVDWHAGLQTHSHIPALCIPTSTCKSYSKILAHRPTHMHKDIGIQASIFAYVFDTVNNKIWIELNWINLDIFLLVLLICKTLSCSSSGTPRLRCTSPTWTWSNLPRVRILNTGHSWHQKNECIVFDAGV